MKSDFLRSARVSALLALIAAGCGGDPEPAAPPPVQPAAEAVQPMGSVSPTPGAVPPPTAVSAPASPAAAAANAAPEQEIPSKDALEAVTMAVQSYFIRYDRAPATLDELINSGYLRKLPAPPAGKKYVYDAEKANIRLEDL